MRRSDWSPKVKRKVQPEGVIKKHLVDALKMQGWMVKRIMQGPLSEKGMPDLIAIRDKRVICIEVKTETGKQSEYQIDFEQNWKAHGGEYIVASKLEDLKEAGMIDGIIGVGQ